MNVESYCRVKLKCKYQHTVYTESLKDVVGHVKDDERREKRMVQPRKEKANFS